MLAREELLLVIPVTGLASLCYLSYRVFLLIRRGVRHTSGEQNIRPTPLPSAATQSDNASKSTTLSFLNAFDGPTILVFNIVRLLGVLTLLALQIVQTPIGKLGLNISTIAIYAYLSVLSLTGIMASTPIRDPCNKQLAILLLVVFAVYFYLDGWPYATTHGLPATDANSRARLASLTVAACVVPLFSPRPFRPSRPGEPAILAETVSLFSRLTYTFMDGIIFRAWRIPHLGIDEMLVLPDKEHANVLRQKAFPDLDPILLGKKRYILWGMLRIFGIDYLWLLFWMCAFSTARFAAPYGMKNLLAYVETKSSPYNLRPWVWILVLALGPVVTAFLNNQWLYVGTRTIAETDSILTQLVFEHSLRIRLNQGNVEKSLVKDEVAQKTLESKAQSDDAPESGASGSATPADSISDGATVEPSDEEASEADTLVDETATSAKDKVDMSRETGHIVGKINNLITSDLTQIDYSYVSLLLPTSLLQTILSIWFLYEVVGWSAFVGFAVIIITMPIPTYIGKLIMTSQKDKMRLTDRRVQSVTETLGVLRMVKLFAWESRVTDSLAKLRSAELRETLRQRLIEVVLRTVSSIMPLIAKLSTFAVYALVMKGEISASRIFSALMVFTMMEEQIRSLIHRVPEVLKVKVSYDRFNEFINGTKMLDRFTEELKENGNGSIGSGELQNRHDSIGFHECIFTWEDFPREDIVKSARGRRHRFALSFEDVTFQSGQINLIVGPTGAGKTSILMALLGEMHYHPKGPDSWYNLPRDMGVAYAAQESWVLNATIRNNILLGAPYDEVRYQKVLRQCALERDLALWEAGDATEVGEKGLTLSGGQKARVTLARAIYSQALTLLLDDVLAALDVHTAKWIVDEALGGELLTGRTVILVTHNIALTAPVAKHVIVLGRSGQITASGSVAEVLQSNSRLRAQAETEKREEADEIAAEPKVESDDGKGKLSSKGKLVVAEEIAIGRIGWQAVKLYIFSFGGFFPWLLFFGLEVSTQLANIFQKWIMAYWSSQYETHPSSEVPVMKFLLLYALGSVIELIQDQSADIFWIFRTMRASRIIHARLVQSVFSSTMRWLDVTPVGRIITRCTQDISAVDGSIQATLFAFLYMTVVLSSYFITSVVMAGWYAMVPGIVMIGLGGFLGHVYLRASLCVRREMSNLKGPMVSQVTTTLGALPSIRAFGAQGFFRDALKEKVDLYTRASLTLYDSNRWISIRVETLGGLFAGVVSTYFIYGSHAAAGYIGFTLSMLVSFSRLVLGWVRVYNEFELKANSIERIQSYLNIEHEAESTEEGIPPAYWPSSGHLRVENLCARYSDESPEILHGISFDIASGERVGVVGRTGAGKSTITLALLRAIKTSGKIYYDGIATDSINLDALRSNITLIPQQPELLRGSLRENLDPFNHHDDATLNGALRAAGLFDLYESGSATASGSSASAGQPATVGVAENDQGSRVQGKIDLDTMVESGGTNFSLGQRQIIALARAIVRRSKLIILDEATAAIDYATDIAIQKALRTEFGTDTTFITVAHRLQTIMDYDKIMVLDDGKLVEFDSPKKLLGNEKGLLRALVEDSEDRESLMRLAGL